MKVSLIPLLAFLALAHASTFDVYVGNAAYEDGGVSPYYMFSAFYPTSLTVKAGDSINFHSNDWEIHWVAFWDGVQANIPSTLDMGPGGVFFQQWTNGNDTNTVTPGVFISSPLLTKNGPLQDNIGSAHYVENWEVVLSEVGTYHFVCPQHPVTMVGTVTVIAADGAYPVTVADNLAAAQQAMQDDIAGVAEALDDEDVDADEVDSVTAGDVTTWTIYMGFSYGEQGANYNAFYPKNGRITVTTGDIVKFDNTKNVHQPHTVTFNSSGTYHQFEFWSPEANAVGLYPLGLAPTNPTEAVVEYDGGFINSGMMLPPDPTSPKTFSVKFTKAGIYSYICYLHDSVAMNGQITVKDSAASMAVASLFLLIAAVSAILL